MGVASPLTLIANPGSASHKYALYDGEVLRLRMHVEYVGGNVVNTIETTDNTQEIETDLKSIADAPLHILKWLHDSSALKDGDRIDNIGLRIVAPGELFLRNHIITDEIVAKLEQAKSRAPIHLTASLDEYYKLRDQFPDARIVSVSDSAFHATKPDHAWNYGLPLDMTDRLELKRFGYHGLSVGFVSRALKEAELLPRHTVVCHIGGGVSVTALLDGHSIDNTMGYSPLDGVIMATRSGSLDWLAVKGFKEDSKLSDEDIETYLNTQSGLLGLGGSDDIRELLVREANGDSRAILALNTYVYTLQKAIGQMVAALGGCDALVLTGTISQRSVPMREKLLRNMDYLGLSVDPAKNSSLSAAHIPTNIAIENSKPIFVLETDEAMEMVYQVLHLSSSSV